MIRRKKPSASGLVESTLNIVRRAGRLAASMRGKLRIEYKGRINPVTNADRKTEKFLIKELSRLGDYGFLCEENSLRKIKKTMWVIDPIDGTVNYAHGLDKWSVNVALVENGVPVLAVTNNPGCGEIFHAGAGKGAFLNGRKIKVSREKKLDKALLATGFPYYVWKKPRGVVNLFSKFLVEAQGIRRYGCASLDMAYVACGRFEGFWEEGLYPWDIAAGKLIIEETGGKVTDYGGKTFKIGGGRENTRRTLLCSNGLLHAKMVSIASSSAVNSKLRGMNKR